MRQSVFILSVFVIATFVLGACSPGALGNAGGTGQPGASTPDTASVQINGAGGTFPLPVYSAWIYAYQQVDPSVTLNYQCSGSGGVKKGIIDGTIDFAGSDSLLSDQEYTDGKDLQMYPMVAGAIVPIFNIQGFTGDLILSRETLAGIYSAK